MIRLVKENSDKNTLNSTLKSLKTTITDLKSGFSQQSLLLASNMVIINSWMQTMNNYYLQLMQYKAYIDSLIEQGVDHNIPPVYIWCTKTSATASNPKVYKYTWTSDPKIANRTDWRGALMDESTIITETDALWRVSKGAKVYLAFYNWVNTDPDNPIEGYWDVIVADNDGEGYDNWEEGTSLNIFGRNYTAVNQGNSSTGYWPDARFVQAS